MIKAIFIDIDNTLLDFNKNAAAAMKMAFEEYKLPFDVFVFPTFKKTNDILWGKIEKKEITREILHDIRWNIILKELNIDFDGHIIEKTFLDNLNLCALHVDGALKTVKYLSSKYLLCTASNAPTEQQLKRLALSGLMPYVKHAFISERIGANKPSRLFFERSFAEIPNIQPSETVMIGDSLTADIAGGKAFGMKTVWFNFDRTDCASCDADYIVNSLAEIKNIL